ncbi:MAG: hypothetical protein ACK5R5_02905 [Alphaproteobacteria bacterium]
MHTPAVKQGVDIPADFLADGWLFGCPARVRGPHHPHVPRRGLDDRPRVGRGWAWLGRGFGLGHHRRRDLRLLQPPLL